jgi:radical SAM-linked protein
LTHAVSAAGGHRHPVTASVSTFVPKPHTPFQWAPQITVAETEARQSLLRRELKRRRLGFKWHDARLSYLEGVFSRGDRRLGVAVREAWRRGCRFDGWTDHLRLDVWRAVFAGQGLDPAAYLSARRTDVRQPWEHVRGPVSRKYLLAERERAFRGEATPDCRLAECHACGIPDCPDRVSPTGRRSADLVQVPAPAPVASPVPAPRRERKSSLAASLALAVRFRLRFLKGEALRFVAHLELLRVWERALRRSGLPLALSQGFRPHIKMSFGPPLPVGYSSLAEYMDLEFSRPPAADLLETLNPLLPDGLQVTGWRPILYRTASLMSALDTAAYRIRLTDAYVGEGGLDPTVLDDTLSRAVAEILGRDQLLVTRNGKDGPRMVDIRPSIEALEPLASGRGLDCWIRMAPGRQARPEEVLSLLVPGTDPRLAHVERTGLWATAGDRRLDPFELLSSAAAPLPETSRAMG